MPRVARVVIADVAHHVAQRGNRRQFILFRDAGRQVYHDLLRQEWLEQPLAVLGYWRMSNQDCPKWRKGCQERVKKLVLPI